MPVGTSGYAHWFEHLLTLLVPSHGAKVFLISESGTVAPLLTNTASAAWHPSRAFGGDLPVKGLIRSYP